MGKSRARTPGVVAYKSENQKPRAGQRFFFQFLSYYYSRFHQFAFFGRLLVKKFFVKKVLRGAKKLGSGARFLLRSSFFAPRRTFSQRTSLTNNLPKKANWVESAVVYLLFEIFIKFVFLAISPAGLGVQKKWRRYYPFISGRHSLDIQQ